MSLIFSIFTVRYKVFLPKIEAYVCITHIHLFVHSRLHYRAAVRVRYPDYPHGHKCGMADCKKRLRPPLESGAMERFTHRGKGACR